jgi:hypothetical protein
LSIHHLDRSVVGEHVDVGRFGADDELGAKGEVGGGTEVGKFGNGGTGFEVRLAVEVLGFDIADVLLLRGRTDDEVCRNGKKSVFPRP